MPNQTPFAKFDREIIEAVVANTPNGILICNENHEVIYINRSAAQLLSLTLPLPEHVPIRSLIDTFPIPCPPEDANHLFSLAKEDIQLHYRIITAPDRRFCDGYAVLLLDSMDTLSAKERLETAWRITSELSEVLEGSFDGILVTDADGNVVYVNSSYERVTAISREKLIGKNMRDLINPVWMDNAVTFLVCKEGKAVSKQHMTQDGRDIIVTGKPVYDNDGNIKLVVINARDTTEIYQMREELLNAKNRELQHYESILQTADMKDENLIAVSPSIKKVFSLASRVGPFDTTVLILGESGTGKEEVARLIHKSSLRREQPLITINCGAIPENLLESELFGYEKGAFTGASAAGKVGLLEAADKGTVFLDEIGEIPLSFQVKLLRVLETRQITRVGGITPRTVDIRFIAATNQNLPQMVKEGTFREDFLYRLNVISITVPPLRERKEDILPLSLFFLNQFNRKYSQKKTMTPDVIRRFEEHEWQGNVRELRNIIESMVVLSPSDSFQISDIPWIASQCRAPMLEVASLSTSLDGLEVIADEYSNDLNMAVQMLERRLLLNAKAKCVTTRQMAKFLKIDQSTVVRKLQRYGLT